MRLQHIAFVILCCIMVPVPGACYDLPDRINAGPLLFYEKQDAGYELSLAGPILEFTASSTAVRPLFYHDDSRTDILYPLGQKGRENSYLVPFFRNSHHDDEESLDILLLSKGRYQEETYGGFFPFYGTYSHRFGHDNLRYFLWPLYTEAIDDGRPTYSMLWPIGKYSPGREFHVFPLYGYEKTVNYRQDYFLWPFILHRSGRNKIDAILPFYYYTRGDTYKGISIVWPLFTYNHNSSPEFTSLSMPWPLVRFAWGEYEEKRVFPFYWSKKDGESYSMDMFLWPIYKHSTSYNAKSGIRESDTSILVLSGRNTVLKNDIPESRADTIWPLWHHHRFPGRSSWYFPWLIPIHDDGFSKNYLPILTLAKGEKTGASSGVDILWHTIRYSKQDTGSRFSLSFLFSYESTPDNGKIGFLSELLYWKWAREKPTE